MEDTSEATLDFLDGVSDDDCLELGLGLAAEELSNCDFRAPKFLAVVVFETIIFWGGVADEEVEVFALSLDCSNIEMRSESGLADLEAMLGSERNIRTLRALLPIQSRVIQHLKSNRLASSIG